MFASTSTGVLRKDPTLGGDVWKVELNNQIAQFVRMLHDCLKNVSHVSPELTARLDMYTAKLAPSEETSNGSSTAGPSRGATPSLSISHNVNDMKLVKAVAELGHLADGELQVQINNLRRTCTEKVGSVICSSDMKADWNPQAALMDLKICHKNIHAGEAFPASREDFETESAWQHWKNQELSQLSQHMKVMLQFNPELIKSAPPEVVPSAPSPRPGARPESLYSRAYDQASRQGSISSRHSLAFPSSPTAEYPAAGNSIEEDDEVPVGHNFTFIPPSPKRYYKRLLELCIQADLEAMENLPPDQEVSLGILSAQHVELLNECVVRWRVAHSYRAVCFLDVIKYKFEREEVPQACIPEAFQIIDKTLKDVELDKWFKQDVSDHFLRLLR